MPPRSITRRLVDWNGSPYQPVPVAEDVRQKRALRILEQPEDYPGVVVEQQSVRAYPRPFGINAAHVLGYLSPITEEEFDKASDDGDRSVNGASWVGRAGVEKEYDAWLRGIPGYRSVEVDSMGRVLDDDDGDAEEPARRHPGHLDRRPGAERRREAARGDDQDRPGDRRPGDRPQLRRRLRRRGRDGGRHRPDRGDGQPADVRPLGVGRRDLPEAADAALLRRRPGTPLLGRATQGQFAPGSTWKPFMTAGALTHGYGFDTRLNCSSSFQVGNRAFKNYESGAYGYIGFDKALEVSCNTFFYRVGYDFWQRFGSDVDDVDARDPLVEEAQKFGFGSETGIDMPGEASGRIADRKWKRAYFESQKDYYCDLADKPQDSKTSDFVYKFAQEFCIEGYAYRAGDAVNFAIGQGDTIVTPLQLARGYAAIANGGTLYEPRIGKAIVVARRHRGPADRAEGGRQGRRTGQRDGLHRRGAQGGHPAGHDGVEDGRLPARRGADPLQDRLGRGLRQAVDVVGRVVLRRLRRGDDDQPGRHRLRHVRPGHPQDLGVAVRRPRRAASCPATPRSRAPCPPSGLPTFRDDGSILPPKED